MKKKTYLNFKKLNKKKNKKKNEKILFINHYYE